MFNWQIFKDFYINLFVVHFFHMLGASCSYSVMRGNKFVEKRAVLCMIMCTILIYIISIRMFKNMLQLNQFDCSSHVVLTLIDCFSIFEVMGILMQVHSRLHLFAVLGCLIPTLLCSVLLYFILFCYILFFSVFCYAVFWAVIFCSLLHTLLDLLICLCSVWFYFVFCSVMLYFILLYSVMFSVIFCWAVLYCIVLVCTLFCSFDLIPFHSALFYFTLLYSDVWVKWEVMCYKQYR
jgi:hypothetical protein